MISTTGLVCFVSARAAVPAAAARIGHAPPMPATAAPAQEDGEDGEAPAAATPTGAPSGTAAAAAAAAMDDIQTVMTDALGWSIA